MLHEKDNISVILKTTAALFLQQTLINNSHQNHTSLVHYYSQPMAGRIVISSGVQSCIITFFPKVRPVVKDTWAEFPAACWPLLKLQTRLAEETTLNPRDFLLPRWSGSPRGASPLSVFHTDSPEAIRERCCGKTKSSAHGLQSPSFSGNQELSSSRQWFCFLNALKHAKMLHL